MSFLLLVSLLWAFSFGLIKGELTGIDSSAIAFLRLFIAWLAFLPFSHKPENNRLVLKLILIGMLQFGMMYILYIRAFLYLQAWEVALFTVFTPIYVTAVNDVWERKPNHRYFLAALLSVIALIVLKWQKPVTDQFLQGFFLMQGSNLSFALGQIAYKKVLQRENHSDSSLMAWLYLGGCFLALITALSGISETLADLNSRQWLVLIYLGVAASGIGFWGWNAGARKVNAGILAVFNNLKIPLALLVSVLFFGEKAPPVKLMISMILLLLAVALPEKIAASKSLRK